METVIPMGKSVTQETRELLEKYSESEPHHAFHLKKRSSWFPWVWVKGRWYEGYIHEVKENTIIFSWAYSPLPYEDGSEEEFEIPIHDIDLSTLAW